METEARQHDPACRKGESRVSEPAICRRTFPASRSGAGEEAEQANVNNDESGNTTGIYASAGIGPPSAGNPHRVVRTRIKECAKRCTTESSGGISPRDAHMRRACGCTRMCVDRMNQRRADVSFGLCTSGMWWAGAFQSARQNRHTSTAATCLFVCEPFPLSRSAPHEAKTVARNVAGENGLRGNARGRLPAAGFLICRKQAFLLISFRTLRTVLALNSWLPTHFWSLTSLLVMAVFFVSCLSWLQGASCYWCACVYVLCVCCACVCAYACTCVVRVCYMRVRVCMCVCYMRAKSVFGASPTSMHTWLQRACTHWMQHSMHACS